MEEHLWHIVGTAVAFIAPVLIILALKAYDRRLDAKEGAGQRPAPSNDNSSGDYPLQSVQPDHESLHALDHAPGDSHQPAL